MENFIKVGFIAGLAVGSLTVALDRPAQALSVVCTGFTGTCAASNWIVGEPGSSRVSITPSTAYLISDNSEIGFSVAFMLLDRNASLPGTASFDYTYVTTDENANFDPFGYILWGPNQIIPPPILSQNEKTSGTLSFNVEPGDLFGFFAESVDGFGGPSIISIENFSYAEVPGPLPILGVAAAFGYSRKLKKRIKNNSEPEVSL